MGGVKFEGLASLLTHNVEPNSVTIIEDTPTHKLKIVGDKDGKPTICGWCLESFDFWQAKGDRDIEDEQR